MKIRSRYKNWKIYISNTNVIEKQWFILFSNLDKSTAQKLTEKYKKEDTMFDYECTR